MGRNWINTNQSSEFIHSDQINICYTVALKLSTYNQIKLKFLIEMIYRRGEWLVLCFHVPFCHQLKLLSFQTKKKLLGRCCLLKWRRCNESLSMIDFFISQTFCSVLWEMHVQTFRHKLSLISHFRGGYFPQFCWLLSFWMLKAFHSLMGHKSFFKPDTRETLTYLPTLSSIKYGSNEILLCLKINILI